MIHKLITVGKGCWIGANAIILPGVTIGDGCIMGAGAVVNKDCAPIRQYPGAISLDSWFENCIVSFKGIVETVRVSFVK